MGLYAFPAPTFTPSRLYRTTPSAGRLSLFWIEGAVMALACPRCKGSGQVLHLPEFVASLPGESPLRGKYGQPPEYVAQWLLPVGAVVLGVVLLVAGEVAAGLLLLAGGGATGFWFSRLAAAAEEARERWARSLYCRQCPATFLREDAVSV